jgi:hypothetical protein
MTLAPALWDATRDPTTGRPTVSSILVECGPNGVTWASVMELTHKQIADYDSARVYVLGGGF